MEDSQYPHNPQRLTPYPNSRFRVLCDGEVVPGVSFVAGLIRRTVVAEHRGGADPGTIHHAPGHTTYEPITLRRGASFDPTFERWANAVYDLRNASGPAGMDASLADFRKDLTIEIFNEAGQLVIRYQVHQAWVTEYRPLSDLDANGDGSFVTESVTLAHEGWERDDTVASQQEPSFRDPAG